ncbi:MAG TPA: 50S ribosomal protein L11 methyltransferase [Blastocatellia bacterium]|nr:50S ribosomal protein L11 methyltransferase [Blastocatellia bacterium]
MSLDSSQAAKFWRLVTVRVGREAEELAASSLFDLGATGTVTLEETSDCVSLGAYFDASAEPEAVRRSIEATFSCCGFGSSLLGVCFSEIPDQDWMQRWKEGFEPLEVGERFVVAPSWKLPVRSDDRIVIQIDPGMAFGTGTHETTRLCLEAIERHWRGGSMLDVGTGTGILAIGAALLCPGSRVVGIDVDPQAVRIARENVGMNGAASVEISEAQLREYAGCAFDMVVANLTAEMIVSLMDDLAACKAEGGTLILSGILNELAALVESRVIEAGLTVAETRDAGDWSSLVAR